ncbi:helix-turn-helix domain-containing protein [Mycobacterium vicinigordonae]|uniref:Helix-turn-helix domain-containing protein n=1 Tax=Mycobacterium vicinigordonae TaxID=1719132 RepID=A0A7D6HQ00_9MYCO|nr:helix-turn-helix domain-containing protein [Mycobacterium vicinigordonae]QLL07271.1 helix-turn-helix domain-containing protein [Mycobacterium vicinigordonae]
MSQRFAQVFTADEGAGNPVHMRRRQLGSMSFDELELDSEIRYRMAPLDRIVLTRVRTGYIELDRAGGQTEVLTPADQVVALPTENLTVGMRGSYEMVTFKTADLTKVAAAGATDRGPVRLLSPRPVSAATAQQLSSLIDYLRDHILSQPEACDSPAIASNAASLLAASVLNTFHSTVSTKADPLDPVKSSLMRRAIAFIDERAHTDIALDDIAAAIHVTPRGLQHMFRRQLGCTPISYLRRVRLSRAHEELLDADPATVSVSAVARRWGFAHGGRFAAYYRQHYGQHPRVTLHGQPAPPSPPSPKPRTSAYDDMRH